MNRLLLFFSLSLLVACSSSEENSHEFQIYVEDGVTVADTSGGPKYHEELFEYSHLTAVIEDPTNEESYLVGPTSITVDDKGFYYVSDGRDSKPGGIAKLISKRALI